jgi:capsular exopolysaccharide synthesis family protein
MEEYNKIEINEETGMTVADYLNLMKSKWYWFVLSVIVCISVAVLYLQITPEIYERTARLMIKDEDKKGGGVLDEMSALSELNFFSPKSNVNNEAEILRSKRMRQEVIRRLNLSVNHKLKSGLKTVELYRNSPVTVGFPDAEEGESFSFTLKFSSKEEVELSNFKQGEEMTEIPEVFVKARMRDTIDTPVGRTVVFPTLYYTDEYLDVPVYISKSELYEVTESLNIDVNTEKTNTVITLSIKDNVPERADDILNTLIAVYNEDNITYKNQVVVNTSDFINEHLDVIERELGSVDEDISEYRSKNMAANIQASTEIFLTESSVYNKQIFELQNQLSVAEFIKEYLANPANNNGLIPSNSGIENPGVEKQIAEYNTMMLKRERLIENGSEKSPAVIELTNASITMKQSIIRAIDNLTVVLNLQIEGAKNKETQTNKKIAGVPQKEQEMIPIKRRLVTQENLYLYLLKKRVENELDGAATISNLRIIDEADGSIEPVAPKSKIILLAALIVGLFIPFSIFWLKDLLYTGIRGAKDITDNLTIPFLGTIPLNRQKNKKKSKRNSVAPSLVVRDNSRDPVSEAFRVIRSNMDFMTAKNNARVIMATSFNADSGKSFVSLNLAMSFALAGKKVIIVDSDLRKAFVSSCAGSPKMGISAYLSGVNSDLDELIVNEWLNPNLDILPVGKLPPNPAELLLDTKFRKLISVLRERYDYVFLDTTPINIVADASIVAEAANMTLFVVREGLLDRRMLPELEQIYRTGKFPNMAVLLNGSNMSSSKYYGRYGYGGYGYGS